MLRETILSTIRKVFCQSLYTVTAPQTVDAIQRDISLLDTCNTEISGISQKIPSFVLTAGKRHLDVYLHESNTTVTALTLAWLKEDRPDLFIAIMTTTGGIPWFNKQVNTIMQNFMG